MAQTSRVLESRRFLKLVYITILALIALVIVIIALIVIENKNLKNEDSENYEQIINNTEEAKEEIQLKQTEIDSLKSAISYLDERDFQKRVELLTRLIDAYDDLIEKIDNSLEQLYLIDTLLISDELKRESRIEIYSLEEIKDLTNDAINMAQKERSISQYFIAVEKALKCFNEVDTNKLSSEIQASVNLCNEFLDSASSNINTISTELTDTNSYLSSISKYWEINVSLHQSIEGQDEAKANELTKSLNDQEALVISLEDLSRTEISQFLTEE